MTKEEILEKSRMENKNQDIYEKEVLIKANQYSGLVAIILATVFFIIQIFTGGGINYALYAIVFSVVMTTFWAKYLALRKKHELLVAICYTIMVILLSVAHICSLFTASGIM